MQNLMTNNGSSEYFYSGKNFIFAWNNFLPKQRPKLANMNDLYYKNLNIWPFR